MKGEVTARFRAVSFLYDMSLHLPKNLYTAQYFRQRLRK